MCKLCGGWAGNSYNNFGCSDQYYHSDQDSDEDVKLTNVTEFVEEQETENYDKFSASQVLNIVVNGKYIDRNNKYRDVIEEDDSSNSDSDKVLWSGEIGTVEVVDISETFADKLDDNYDEYDADDDQSELFFTPNSSISDDM
eukprot:TRINITY_DN80329_c0_g1_i1.p1 TRINITY_DN80329_c0_g1~~TRINITY_DN80329_c0_g1_i1.p1  ORF type:complete len:163 (+),score=40.97 TRINITY_DN80329_c0_g1_i1:65-490(+)